MSTRFQADYKLHFFAIPNHKPLYTTFKDTGVKRVILKQQIKDCLNQLYDWKKSRDCINRLHQRSVQGKMSISIMVNGLHLYTVVPFCLTRLFLPIKHNLIHQWWRGCSGRQWPGNYGETFVLLKDTWKCKTGGAKTWILLVNRENIFPKSH